MSFCSGARRYTVRYTHTEPDKLSFSGSGQVYCPINGGRLSAEWIENIAAQQYFDLGYFENGSTGACGESWGYFCGYYGQSAVGTEYLEDGQRTYKPYSVDDSNVAGDGYSQGDATTKVYAGLYQRDIVDIVFETDNITDQRLINQWGTLFTGGGVLSAGSALYKFDQCTPRDRPFHLGGGRYYPSGTYPSLGILETRTYRANKDSLWYASIKENGNEIFVYGEKPGATRGTAYPDFLPPPNRQIQLTPSTSFPVEITYTKSLRDSSIYIETEPFNGSRYSSSDRRVYIGGDRFRLRFVERDSNGNYISGTGSQYILSGGVPIPEDFEFICEFCPQNTCAVDCGDKICCYGSDGIATDFYYK